MINYKLINTRAPQPDAFLKKKGPPILIVPLHTTATVTKYNVQDFLQGHGHQSTLKLLASLVAKPEKLIFKRAPIQDSSQTVWYTLPSGLPTEIEVIDSVNDLKPDDWDRVVGVFCVGKEWQFKGFKWESSKDLFSNVPGIFVYDSTDPNYDPSLGKDWKVGKYDLSIKNQGHYFRFLSAFWNSIDHHILEKKPWYVNCNPYWS